MLYPHPDELLPPAPPEPDEWPHLCACGYEFGVEADDEPTCPLCGGDDVEPL